MAFSGRKRISDIRADLAAALNRSGNLPTPTGVSNADEYARESAEKLLRIRKLTKETSVSSGTSTVNSGNYSDTSFQFGSKSSRVRGPIDKNVLEQVYGDVEEAFGLVQRFEDDYFAAIDEAIRTGADINKDILKARGVIDLNQLPKAKADELMNQFMSNVIKVRPSAAANAGPTLTSVAGLPGMQLHSVGDYTESLFRYVIDQTGGQPGARAYHPHQIILNAMNFSYKKGKQGLDTLTVSKQMPSVATLRSIMADVGEGFKGTVNPPSNVTKSLVFDVESTGVTKGSVLRALTISEMVVNPDGSKSMNTIMNFAFDSPQLRRLREIGVGSTGRSLVESLAEKEGTEIIDVGAGGKNVVSKLTEVLEMINDPQYGNLIAHNSNFDISMLLGTITKQDAFAMDERAQQAVRNIYERIENDPTYVKDTLHKSRIYQLDQANSILQNILNDPSASMDDLNKAYVNALFAEEQLPLLGRKTVGFASVGNIALGTNLFELMEQDVSAREVFETIARGSHIAETDVILQGYTEMYMNEGRLATWALTQNQGGQGPVKTATGDFLRNIIARSSAVTPTTNLDDAANLSQYLTTRILSGSEDESLRAIAGAQIRIIGSEDQVKKSLASLGLEEDLGKGVLDVDREGIIRFTPEGGLIQEDLMRKKITLEDQTKGLRFIRQTISDAVSDTGPKVTATLVGGTVLSDNLARQSIASLGITVSANQAAEDMGLAARVVSSVSGPAILGFGRETEESLNILESGLTAVYRNLGTKSNITSAVLPRAQGQEPPPILYGGMAKYGPEQVADLAQSLNAIGDPFSFLSPESRYTSTYLAALTSNAAANAASSRSIENLTAAQRLLSPKGKKLGTTQGLGLVYSSAMGDDYQRIITRNLDGTDVPIMSNRLFETLTRKAGIDLSYGYDMRISLVENFQGKMINLKTMFGETGGPLTKAHGLALAEQIVKSLSEESSLRSLAIEMGYKSQDIDLAFRESFESRTSTTKPVQELRQLYENHKNMAYVMNEKNINKAEMAKELAETINKRGVVHQRLSPDLYDQVVDLAESLGISYQNDVEMPIIRKVFDAPEGSAGIVYDPDLIDRLGQRGEFEDAVKSAERAYGEISERLDADLGPQRRGALLDDITREAGYTRRAVLADTYSRASSAVSSFVKQVPGGPKSLVAAAGAAVMGIMAYRKSQQNEIYNETVEKQPYEPTNYIRSENESLGYLAPTPSSRRDPLLTAGVVGNLDRNKINHTRMGNGKYDHLY